jgi:hypothetical protein
MAMACVWPKTQRNDPTGVAGSFPSVVVIMVPPATGLEVGLGPLCNVDGLKYANVCPSPRL